MKTLSAISLLVGIVLSSINIYWIVTDQRFRDYSYLSEMITQRAAAPAIDQSFIEFSPAYFDGGFKEFVRQLKRNPLLPHRTYANEIGRIATNSCRTKDCSEFAWFKAANAYADQDVDGRGLGLMAVVLKAGGQTRAENVFVRAKEITLDHSVDIAEEPYSYKFFLDMSKKSVAVDRRFDLGTMEPGDAIMFPSFLCTGTEDFEVVGKIYIVYEYGFTNPLTGETKTFKVREEYEPLILDDQVKGLG